MIRSLRFNFFKSLQLVRDVLPILRLLLPELKLSKKKPPVIPAIVSMTTYPARIRFSWVALETMLRQSVSPLKLVLMLNLEEFPDRVIPRRIRKLERRGLHILWSEKNGFSYDKLIPVVKAFPDTPVITVDDDKLFPKRMLEDLWQVSIKHPGTVVGTRGWIVKPRIGDGEIHYGENWIRASRGSFGLNLLVPGGNGCLYPPNCLAKPGYSFETALKICPTADDIWFWAAAQKKMTPTICLGYPAHRPVLLLRRSKALSSVNGQKNDEQFQKAIAFFSLEKALGKRMSTW